MHDSEKPICALPISHILFLTALPLDVCLIDDRGPLLSFQGRSSSTSSTFHTSLFQVINGVMSLGFAPTGSVSNFSTFPADLPRSKPLVRVTVCGLPVYLLGHLASLQSGMSIVAHPEEFVNVDADHRHILV